MDKRIGIHTTSSATRSFEIDPDGSLRALLESMSSEERQEGVSRLIAELPRMQDGWYRGLHDLVAEVDTADLERVLGAQAMLRTREVLASIMVDKS